MSNSTHIHSSGSARDPRQAMSPANGAVILPTDSEIHDFVLMHSGSIMPTYYIKNMLRSKFPKVTTPWVLRRLKALEKAGKVRRVPTSYATMICWDIVRAAASLESTAGGPQ